MTILGTQASGACNEHNFGKDKNIDDYRYQAQNRALKNKADPAFQQDLPGKDVFLSRLGE